MNDLTSPSELIGVGLYTITDAASLMHMPSRTVRRWMVGSVNLVDGSRRGSAPLWTPDLAQIDGQVTLTFRDLMELRCVRALATAGLKLRDVRRIAADVCAGPARPLILEMLRGHLEKLPPAAAGGRIGDGLAKGWRMAQMGFFDLSDRYASLDAKQDPLLEIDALVPWNEFRPLLTAIWRKPPEDRKSRAGRKPWDVVTMFKTLVLSALYNLSDDQIEFQIRDRLSFMRFLGLGLEDRVPDAKTVWLYREGLVRAGKVEEVFALFDGYLVRQGYMARGGQILDASVVPVPRNHNHREENETIKAGEIPQEWKDKPAKMAQKDVDARWTQKNGKTHFGYKNHVNVDRKHKLVRRWHVTDAAVHDSQAVDKLLTKANTAKDVWADAAYRSAEIEATLVARKLRSRIHRKGHRNRPLSERGKQGNRTKSSIRVRVEHMFGAQANDMGGVLVRTIGLARAKVKIGLKNLTYNMRRLGQLRRLHPIPV